MWNNCSETEAETRTRNSFPHSYVRHTKKISTPSIPSSLITTYCYCCFSFLYTQQTHRCVSWCCESRNRKRRRKRKKIWKYRFFVCIFYFIGWDRHWHVEGIQRNFYDGQCIGMQMLNSSLRNISHQIMFLIIKKLLLRQIWIF